MKNKYSPFSILLVTVVLIGTLLPVSYQIVKTVKASQEAKKTEVTKHVEKTVTPAASASATPTLLPKPSKMPESKRPTGTQTPVITAAPTTTDNSNKSNNTPQDDSQSEEVYVEPTHAPISVNWSNNLVENYSFEETEGSYPVLWAHTPGSINLDRNGNGDQGSNSMRLNAGYLFSYFIQVEERTRYTWQQYVRVPEGMALEMYVDEYDINGNWISGQYKQMFQWPYEGYFAVSYKPTNDEVKFVGLQMQSFSAADDTYIFLDSVYFGKN